MPAFWKSNWFLCSLPALAALVAFGGSLQNDFVNWDDRHLILDNLLIRTLDPRIWWSFDPELYAPLTLLAYQILHLIFGFSAMAFHGFSLLLHIGNVILLFWLLRRIAADDRAAFFGALLFAVHPLHTEAVVWASALKDVLCTFFFLLAVLSYGDSRPKVRRLTPVFFVLALLAKVTAITLPLVMLLMDACKHGRVEKRQFVEKWPYFAIAAVFGIIALIGRGEGAVHLPLLQIVLLAARSIFFYLQHFLIPAGLSAIYPAPPIHIGDPSYALSLLGTLLLVGLCAWLWLKRRWTLVALGIAFYLVTLSPSLLAYKKGGEVMIAADRYAYLPSIGLILVLVGCMMLLTRRRLVTAAVLVAALACIPLAWAQTQTWSSTLAVFTNILRNYPTNSEAYNNIGHLALQAGKLKEAEVLLRTALQYRETNVPAWINFSGTLILMQRYAEAESAAREAVRRDPRMAEAHLNLAWALWGQGKTREAAVPYAVAIQLAPRYAGTIPSLEPGAPKPSATQAGK